MRGASCGKKDSEAKAQKQKEAKKILLNFSFVFSGSLRFNQDVIAFVLILLLVAACAPLAAHTSAPASPSPASTAAPLIIPTPLVPRAIPSRTSLPTLTPVPTETPRPLPSWALPLITAALPTVSPISPASALAAVTADATATADPALIARVEALAASPDALIIGYSVEGRPISARRFGLGARTLLIAGGMHGGWEANTVQLMIELVDHFAGHPDDIPAGASLVIVPAINPDGLIHGRSPRGRFNANGVDLNRNWSCGWSREAVWRGRPVNPGLRALSEPETAGLAAFIETLQPDAVLFYHSAANGIFAGRCDADHGSETLAAVLGEAAGYPYGRPFSAYPVTGTAASWADGMGIPAADVELRGWSSSEFDQNLRGIRAVLEWMSNPR